MDNKAFKQGGSDYLDALIAAAVADGTRTATATGNYEIERAVRIPSDFTLILSDCHLKMADGVYDNLFINEHHGTDVGRTLAGRDRNITLIGRGRAILDGGNYNGLSEKTQNKNGLPPIYKNNLLLFTNVEGFKISDLSFHNQRWWALNFVFCAHGYIGNLDFCANDTAIAPDGTVYRGLTRAKYAEALVKNADGIDLRAGCHHIKIENITGFCEDDSIALTGLWGDLEKTFAVEGYPRDMHHITVKNIRTASFCTNVRLLNQGDVILHDVLVDGVMDTSADCPHLDRGLYGVRVGDVHLYGSRHATEDETYRIEIRNVRSRGEYAVVLAGEMRELILSGIECFDGARMLWDRRGEQTDGSGY